MLQQLIWFEWNRQTIIISCSVYSVTDIYKIIWNKHQQGGIVYEFTEEVYQEFRTLDLEVTQAMNDAQKSGEADVSVSKDNNYFLR